MAARVLYWAALAIWAAVELHGSVALASDDRSQDRGTFTWTRRALLGGLVAVLVIDRVVPPMVPEDDQTVFLLVGAGLVAAGLGWRVWAIRTLGPFFTYQVATRAEQPVIDDGPYRWMSHPSYTGLLVACLGAGLGSANLAILLVVTTGAMYGVVRRIRVEEAAMLQAMGEDYHRYLATRKRLLPGIW